MYLQLSRDLNFADLQVLDLQYLFIILSFKYGKAQYRHIFA
jgi:hypothetical protein